MDYRRGGEVTGEVYGGGGEVLGEDCGGVFFKALERERTRPGAGTIVSEIELCIEEKRRGDSPFGRSSLGYVCLGLSTENDRKASLSRTVPK